MIDYIQMTPGCKEFNTSTSFPTGSNTIDQTDDYKTSIIKTDATNAALLVYDLGWLPQGTRIQFEIEARILSGDNATISIDSRTGVSLTSGRKIVGINNISDTEWRPYKLSWIVGESDNWITLLFGSSTTAINEVEFRNPRFEIKNAQDKKVISCGLLRQTGNWSIDTLNFSNDGFKLEAAAGQDIELSFPERNNDKNPVVHVTVDAGFSLETAGFINAGTHTVSKSTLKIKLITTSGAPVSDVTSGGTARLNISVVY